MKTRKKILASLLLYLSAAAFTACSSEDGKEEAAVRQPIVLNGEVFSIDSKVGTVWSGGQAVGVYMLKSGTAEVVDNYANVKYLADNRGATGYLVPADNEPMYLPADGSQVDIRAYYPYDPNAGKATSRAADIYTTEVVIDEKTKPDDFLYSQNSKGLSNSNTHTTVEIRSMLSLVKIDFECSLDGGAGLRAHIKNIANRAVFNLIEGKFTNYSVETETPLPMTGTTTQNTNSVTFNMKAVILPGQINRETVLTITVNDDKGNILKEYNPVSLQDVLELKEEQVEENTQYNVAAQLTEKDEIETQLTGTSAICILNWTGGNDSPEGGVAHPDTK